VHAGIEKVAGDFVVFLGGHHDAHGIDFPGQVTIVVDGAGIEFPGHPAGGFLAGIADGDQVGLVEQSVFLGVKAAQVTHADHGSTNFRHQGVPCLIMNRK